MMRACMRKLAGGFEQRAVIVRVSKQVSRGTLWRRIRKNQPHAIGECYSASFIRESRISHWLAATFKYPMHDQRDKK
eukprot:6177415-Pleurochrysis_carterae.AAC.1